MIADVHVVATLLAFDLLHSVPSVCLQAVMVAWDISSLPGSIELQTLSYE